MSTKKAAALVVRTSDWSESSRIATIWTREFGRVRVLAKGARRLKSSFDVALDLLTVCSVVFIHKATSGLDLLTEARVEERFPKLLTDLPALYGGYYVAELLSELTQDMDPHPMLYDAALVTLRELGGLGPLTGQRVMAFELTLLAELGYSPALRHCAGCGTPTLPPLAFSAIAGGLVCDNCRVRQSDARPMKLELRDALDALRLDPTGWRVERPAPLRRELRQLLGQYVGVRLGKRPRVLPYLTD
jgi:DNA repair protein RecO (recombination protein O)